MESLECGENICRICLGNKVTVNWNELILDSCDVTFKDIYYKYTQLEMNVLDPYSQMLCKTCSNDLKTSHFLIIKALESDYILHQTYSTGFNEKAETREKTESLKDDIQYESKYEPTEFEILFFEQHNDESSTDDNNADNKTTCIPKNEVLNENLLEKRNRRISKKPKWVENYILENNSSKSLITPQQESPRKKISLNESPRQGLSKMENIKLFKSGKGKVTDYSEHSSRSKEAMHVLETYSENNETTDIRYTNIEDSNMEDTVVQDSNTEISKISEKRTQNCLTNIQNNKFLKISKEYEDSSNNSPSTLNTQKKQYVYKKTFICSMCPKTYKDKSHLLKHEESHKEHRERSVVCPQCGLKFFFKSDLKLHSAIHNKNREKKYKCEYCNKAYYGRGSLNVHRREHLGQMIPCSICSKEYHRQVDLDRHNRVAHSEVPLYTELKKAPKYVVYCKQCDKTLSTSSWAAHQAAHLKTPLMRCSLCDKDFYSRSTCTYHMDKVHNFKKREEYEQFIIYHKTNRMSHLLIKQHEILQTKSN